MFEDQTKFRMLHEKRIETLGTLFQKFSAFYRLCNTLIDDVQEHLREKTTLKPGEYHERYDPVFASISDFVDFSQSNRLFLSNSQNEKIMDIVLKSGSAQADVAYIYRSLDDFEAVSSFVEKSNLDDEMEIEIENFHTPRTFLAAVTLQLQRQIEALESLYKSTADTTYE